LLQELKRHGFPPEILEDENTRLILEFHNIKNLAELFIRVGQDLLSPHVVLYYFTSPLSKEREQNQSAGKRPSLHDRNVLKVTDLDKGIHKFARCCNPFPSQQDVLAVLSERGITFHHKNCSDLLDRHNLQPQSLLDVEWDLENLWRHSLVFHLRITQERLQSLIRLLANCHATVRIQTMAAEVDRHGQPQVLVTVAMQSFREAFDFFRCLPANKVTIEGYAREEGPQAIW
jgi:GTP pyrophosphokinase